MEKDNKTPDIVCGCNSVDSSKKCSKANFKRTLIITAFYPPNIGGAETFAEELAMDFVKKHETVVLTYKPFNNKIIIYKTDAIDIEHNEGIRHVYRMTWLFKMDKVWKGTTLKNFISVVPKMIWGAFNYQRRYRFTEVISLGVLSAIPGVILSKIFGVELKVIILALYDMELKPAWFRWVVKSILNQADRVFVEGDGGKEDMEIAGVTWDKIVKFEHWTDLNRLRPMKSKHRGVNVLFVGRPIPEKGIDVVRGVEELMKNDNIKFAYAEDVPYDKLIKLYQRADIVCVPSKYSEGYSKVVVEAQAAGCAMVVSNRGSLPYMVADDYNGYRVEPTITDFHSAILRLYNDRKLLADIKKNARRYAVKHYSKNNIKVFE